MTATTAQRRAVNEWLTMLNQIEGVISRSMAANGVVEETETTESGADTKKLTTRIDRRIRKLSERVAAAERSAEEVGAELAQAEAELRQWVDHIQDISKRLSDVRQFA